MKLWLFTFTDQSHTPALVEVAADTKAEACSTLYSATDILVSLEDRGPKRVIVSFHGEDETRKHSAVITATHRNGTRTKFQDEAKLT